MVYAKNYENCGEPCFIWGGKMFGVNLPPVRITIEEFSEFRHTERERESFLDDDDNNNIG